LKTGGGKARGLGVAISMNRIRLLSEQVANQIAAGEVVERPASVVKELVENSLDAGATRLAVEIHAGGRSLIRVTDDGAGDEPGRRAPLPGTPCHQQNPARGGFERHQHPGISRRGPAQHRQRQPLHPHHPRARQRRARGPEILVNGGKIIAVKSCGSAPGACVEVRQLFFNLPARRKFMRADETESAHIQHYLTLAALAFPGVALEFVKDARLVWQLPAVRKEDRLAALRERWARAARRRGQAPAR
jgi:DNA mismatch repair protein MutL